MTWKSRLAGASGEGFSGWPEIFDRRIVVLAVLTVIVLTVAASMTILSYNESETVIVEPNSHYALHVATYGVSRMEFVHSEWTTSFDAYIVELDWTNYRLLIEGKPYNYSGYESIGGYGGESQETSTGLMWDEYIVVVNDGSSPVTFMYQLEVRVYASYLPLGPIAALVAGGAYLLTKRASGRSVRETPSVEAVEGLTSPRNILFVISALVLFIPLFVIVIALVTPGFLSLWISGFISLNLALLVSLAVAFELKFKLLVVPGTPEQVLRDLAQRLRVSRYEVELKRSSLSVHVSSTSAILIRARAHPDGTLVTFQTSATPEGWTLITVGILVFVTIPASWAMGMFTMYRVASFARMRVIPRLSGPPIPSAEAERVEAKAVLIDSLSEGRRLASEAYDSVKSKYEDSVILCIIGAMLVYVALAFATYYLPQVLQDELRIMVSMAVAAAGSLIFVFFALRRLMARSRRTLKELESWKMRLSAALSHETMGTQTADAAPSSFELVLDSYRELPNWLEARKKAVMFRMSGLWLLMFFLAYSVYQLAFTGIVMVASGKAEGWLYLIVALVLACVAAVIYLQSRARQDEEGKQVSGQWNQRYEKLKADMEAFLRSV